MPAHRHLLQLRTSDLDWVQHVNNNAYGDFVQEARVAMLWEWRGSQLTHPEISLVVAAQEITFLRELRFRPEPIAIDTTTVRVGRTSDTVRHQVREPDSDVVYATATTTMVQTDKSTGRPTPVEEGLRATLEWYAEEAT